MSATVAWLIAQDGLVSGAIYALLALALVLVFSVTRIILIPQGEIVAYGALTHAALQAGQVPSLAWLLCIAGAIAAVMEAAGGWREPNRSKLLSALAYLAIPILIVALAHIVVPLRLGGWVNALLALLLVTPLGPLMYRTVFWPVAHAPVLVLLIISVAAHVVLTGLGLAFFGPEGVRTQPFIAGRQSIAGISFSYQALLVMAVTICCIGLLTLLFTRTVEGKALLATACNRVGASIVGIRLERAGLVAFSLAALVGALSGILIAPITTIYYDTGFFIGLKGSTAAILGGLGSYPLAAVGAIAIGLLESFSSFWLSAYKDVIVFGALIPILLWRNLGTTVSEDRDE